MEVVASDAVACEFETNTERFAIVRKNDQALLPLAVNYVIGGTASNGVDYALLAGGVTLAAGAQATNILVLPLGNNLTADQATVTLTLQPATNFSLTTLSNAVITLWDRPLNIWRRANFTVAELADPNISGDLAGPNHDGLSNLMEYALGLAPKDSGPANRPVATIVNGYFTLTYTRSKAATGVSLAIDQSNDLLNWQAGSGYTQTSCIDQGANLLITVQLPAPAGTVSPGFLRLRATRL